MSHPYRDWWFFVQRLNRKERPTEAQEFEIQVLDFYGQTKESVYVTKDDRSAVCSRGPIPLAVIQAAQKRELSDGEYVDSNGQPVSFLMT